MRELKGEVISEKWNKCLYCKKFKEVFGQNSICWNCKKVFRNYESSDWDIIRRYT